MEDAKNSKQKWDEVGDRFSELGRQLKERYDSNATISAHEQEKVDDALRHVSDTLDASFTALGDSLRDAGVRDELKQAGVAIGDAIAATFNDVAGEIKRAVRK